jgi:transposase
MDIQLHFLKIFSQKYEVRILIFFKTFKDGIWYNTNPSSLHRWVVRFKKNGLNGLMKIKKNQNRSLLKERELLWLAKQIKNNPNLTAISLQKMILEHFAIKLGTSSIYNYIKKLGFSHITARSVHYKQNKEKLEEFKKNSTRNKRKKIG